jgi:hypothetical protein
MSDEAPWFVPVCRHSGLPVDECKQPQGFVNVALGTPLCDCFDYPEWDWTDDQN